jgi:hypothetical protein
VAAVCPGVSRGQCSSGGGQQGGSGRGRMKHGHGVPCGLPRGAGQVGDRIVLQPFSNGATVKTCRAPCTWSGN